MKVFKVFFDQVNVKQGNWTGIVEPLVTVVLADSNPEAAKKIAIGFIGPSKYVFETEPRIQRVEEVEADDYAFIAWQEE